MELRKLRIRCPWNRAASTAAVRSRSRSGSPGSRPGAPSRNARTRARPRGCRSQPGMPADNPESSCPRPRLPDQQGRCIPTRPAVRLEHDIQTRHRLPGRAGRARTRRPPECGKNPASRPGMPRPPPRSRRSWPPDCVPPDSAASRASLSAGNRPTSGASKSRRAAATRSSDSTPDAILSGQPSACAIGVRMSGLPSWARIEPSTYSTSECTMLCGCTTTSTCAGSIPNSRQASMSSRPLFISVAESTEILRPIFQRGCAQAWSGVTRRELCARGSQERAARRGEQHTTHASHGSGPPRARPAGTGRSRCARCRSGSASRRRPAPRQAAVHQPTTSDSLFASSTRLPARAAASVDGRPAAPTIAAITASTSGDAATSASARRRTPPRVASPASAQPGLELTRARRVCEHGDTRTVRAALLEQARMIRRGGKCRDLEMAGMSSQHVQRAHADAAGAAEDRDPHHGATPTSCSANRNDGTAAVRPSTRSSTPAVPRQQAAAVLEARMALEHALDQVPDDRQQRHRPRRRPTQVVIGRSNIAAPHTAATHCAHHPGHESLPGLARAHPRRELVPTEAAAAEIGTDVGRSDQHDQVEEQDPAVGLDQRQARETDRRRHEYREACQPWRPCARRAAGARTTHSNASSHHSAVAYRKVASPAALAVSCQAPSTATAMDTV